MNDEQGHVPSDDDSASPPEAAWWLPAAALPPVAGVPEEQLLAPEPPAKRRRRWRKPVVISLVVLLVAAGSGAGAKEYADHRAEEREKARIAAEKRAADAYVKAVRPLAARVFDAAQPIQDALDGFGKRRPGIWQAAEDVARHSGAQRELAAVDKALSQLTVPATHQEASVAIETAIKGLTVSVRELGKAMAATKRSSPACFSCDEQDGFTGATVTWLVALGQLDAKPPMPAAASGRARAEGRRVLTWGGFILASDLACGAAQKKLADLPERSRYEVYKQWPALAKILRANVAALRAVKAPASRRVLHQRLDRQLESVTALATTFEKAYAAVKKRNFSRLTALFKQWDEDVVELRDLGAAYKKQGITNCATFFHVDDEDVKKEYKT